MNKKLQRKEVIGNTKVEIQKLQKNEGLTIPDNYSLGNALASAWLTLKQKEVNKKPVLEYCTKTSIKDALKDMAIQGLSPSKDQGYFIPYGKKLNWQNSYNGNVVAAKRMSGVQDITANVIFKNDKFEYEIVGGRKKVTKHSQSLGSRNANDAIGAYATVTFKDSRPPYVVIMDMDEIENAWSQGKVFKKGQTQNNIPHHKFKLKMMKKTVTSRAARKYINQSNDSGLLVEAFNRSSEENSKSIQKEIEENANSQDFDGAVQEAEDADFEDAEKELEIGDEPEAEPETTDNQGFLDNVEELKDDVPDEEFDAILENFGVESVNQIVEREAQISFYKELKGTKEYYDEQ